MNEKGIDPKMMDDIAFEIENDIVPEGVTFASRAPSVNLIINCDTRPGCDAESFTVGDVPNETLKGVRSWDFLTDGIRNKIEFFKGWDVRCFVVIDGHTCPEEVYKFLCQIEAERHSFEFVVFEKDVPRWNDWLYARSIDLALDCMDPADYIAHFDGDVIAYASPDSKHLDLYESLLKSGVSYVCQPSAIRGHGMRHASTRFFICKTETYDSEEVGRCIDDGYRTRKYGNFHVPCFEHILGLICNWNVHYPPFEPDQYFIGHLVSYRQNQLKEWNRLTYEEVRDLLTPHLHGPMDLLAKDI